LLKVHAKIFGSPQPDLYYTEYLLLRNNSNANLSGKSIVQLDDPTKTVMFFESVSGAKNASDTGQSVPRPGRYSGTTDYAFADGHVKRFPDGTKVSYRLDGK